MDLDGKRQDDPFYTPPLDSEEAEPEDDSWERACPNCGWKSSTVFYYRPIGLPAWICVHCKHRIYRRRLVTDAKELERKEKEDLKALMARLEADKRSSDGGERMALEAMGEEAIPLLQRLLNGRDRKAQAIAAATLAKVGTPEAFAVLLSATVRLENAARLAKRARVGFIFLMWMALFLMVWWRLSGNLRKLEPEVWTIFRTSVQFLAMFGGGWIVTVLVRGDRRKHLGAIALFNNPKALGPLLLASGDNVTRTTAIQILPNILTVAGEENIAVLDEHQQANLLRLLRDKDEKLVIAALHAASFLSTQKAVEAIALLAEPGSAVIDAAEAALAAVQENRRRAEDRATLLRASSSEDEALLLRAASNTETEPEQLLRPADNPP